MSHVTHMDGYQRPPKKLHSAGVTSEDGLAELYNNMELFPQHYALFHRILGIFCRNSPIFS